MARRKGRRRWYLTPRVWNRSCSSCGASQSVAFRYSAKKGDTNRYACSSCVKKRGIHARESKAWRDGGSKAGSAVKVTWVDPATFRVST